MIKALIIDDEIHCRKTLSMLLKDYCPDVQVMGQCSDGESGLDSIQKFKPDLIFLDIEMPNMNGFEMLEKLPEINFEIIFTTSYDQYAIKAIRFSALDYLLKPVDREELQRAVQKATQRLHHPLPQQLEILLQKLHQPASSIQKIALPTMEGLQMIAVNSIISCASDSNYTVFFLKNKQKLIVSRPLKEIEEMLEEYSFLRVHNSYLVSLNEIEKYVKGEGGYLVMTDGSAIDVSRSKKETLLNKLRPNRL
ncbi:MAG TPA: LytTR family DNA-binding domain-containing protein [Chitinophagaceae bacterium]|nr:LytTR family DNA-binding domain-containing protein [Chitinophagaceae bacterium]